MCVFTLGFKDGSASRVHVDICHSHNKNARDFLNPDTCDVIGQCNAAAAAATAAATPAPATRRNIRRKVGPW